MRFCIFFVFCIALGSCNFSPGSYPYAEKYVLQGDEKSVIAAVEAFKKANIKYNVPQKAGLQDGRKGTDDYWYHIYFYYPEESQVIYTWIRLEEKGKTAFALVSVSDGLMSTHWKDINNNFSSSENEEQKKKFETRILKKVKEILQLYNIIVLPDK